MKPNAEEAWIVRARWCNSSDTYYGPWEYVEHAEDYVRDVLDHESALVGWEICILSPSLAAVS